MSGPLSSATTVREVLLDTISVELSTGVALIAKPYANAVDGRHIMLSQAELVWKASRSEREKRFYERLVAAAAAAAAGSAVSSVADVDGLSHRSEEELMQRERERSVVVQLGPFLPRYYGTRAVAALKVGSFALGAMVSTDYSSMCVECPPKEKDNTLVPAMMTGLTTGTTTATESDGNTFPLSSHNSSSRVRCASNISGGGGSEMKSEMHTDISLFAHVTTRSNGTNVKDGGTVSSGDTPEQPALTYSNGAGRSSEAALARLLPPPPLCAQCGDGCGGRVCGSDAVERLMEQFALEVAEATAAVQKQLDLTDYHYKQSNSGCSSPPVEHVGITVDGSRTGGDETTSEVHNFSFVTMDGEILTSPEKYVEDALNKRLPRSSEAAAAPVEMIILEDVCYGFTHPCVLDIKMGCRQYGLHPSPEKKQSKERKARLSTSGAYGIRLAGYKRWDDATRSFEIQTKATLRDLPYDEVKTTIMYFLSAVATHTNSGEEDPHGTEKRGMDDCNGGGTETRAAVREEKCSSIRARLVGLLQSLLRFFYTQTAFLFFTSSLLVVYDAARPLQTCRVVMIDFAHTYTRAECSAVAASDTDSVGESMLDEGYIRGLQSLIMLLQEAGE